MATDNLNGCNLSVLECRDLIKHFRRAGWPSNALRNKLEAGVARETPDETRERERLPSYKEMRGILAKETPDDTREREVGSDE